MNKEEIQEWFKSLQDKICMDLEKTDGKGQFQEDLWQRPEGGGGRTRVITGGHIIEKGGVNFSAVEGPTPVKILEALGLEQADFFATGVSIVMHPHSPMVPIIHMNVRYFEMSNGTSWFGGGIDLTPHYVDEPDAKAFHAQLKACCDRHNTSYYPVFKKWADDYFYIKHRKETRGVGGIFFDRLSANENFSLEDRWAFVQDVGSQFAPIYTELMSKNKDLPFGENEKQWQFLRRGRYAEFNLVWDKGTKFGLDTDGRTESILMSLPPQANWAYNHVPAIGSKEQTTLNLLKKGVDWV
ncbi:oxygen-dependent coproporphyrinogen oxidase [Reichenbachiella carrageenanivorans]|uniref:coproporphyrinogen oxidase n=1 Tax=Reichenbachiella carrageenanivorans TaxID=2979869 RepID=A0ABY6CUK9_9BACT|nr:oxygen-dependent coproporphyrinogen oxidase [Reichenbachiella carrageenanivorans]UXX77621.1 oxygen-dependent coproporphyrinogen oxidase [Reichenbachiella carrageenanivorans]